MMGFSEIYGQEHVVRLLRGALGGKRVAHAYLFRGPAGVGKRFTAEKLAQALNCTGGDATDACGRCSSCGRISRRNHPDLTWVSPGGRSRTIGIEEVRELCRMLEYRAYEGNWKVCVISEADRISLEAANALLKTLEEPTSRTVIILTSEHPDRLPPTIVSRCQSVRFTGVRVDEVARYLIDEVGTAPDRVPLLAALSRGSPGRARALEEGDFEDVRDTVLGWAGSAAAGAGAAFAAVDALLKEQDDFRKGLQKELKEAQKKKVSMDEDGEQAPDRSLAEDVAGEGRRWLTERLDILLYWVRDVLMVKSDSEGKQVINADRLGELRERAAGADASRLEALLELIARTKQLLNMNVNSRSHRVLPEDSHRGRQYLPLLPKRKVPSPAEGPPRP